MKVDEEQEVRNLMQQTRTYDTASQTKLMLVKQFVYKLGADAQRASGNSRVKISQLW